MTALFCDLVSSTELGAAMDPERVRALLARYFDAMRLIVERHGGTVEKFIGDAVVAVFGVPVAHEDDAHRAVRAALEMRDALPGLGLQGRIGIFTGEVVIGTAERLATGEALNMAARLQQAAQPGEVLIGEGTRILIRDAADIEEIGAVSVKGKVEPIPTYRVIATGAAPERRHTARFVGREPELAQVRQARERVVADQRCELFTVVGDAGVGKSRLVAEAVADWEGTVVHGRCLPYGEGITYWPVLEVLRGLDVMPADRSAAQVIRSLLGESTAATSVDEIAWAFRKTVEGAAAHGPVIVVFDDIQWGEDAFTGLVRQVADRSSGAPILLLCVARPELVERHPDWPISLRLGPLAADDVNALMPPGLPAELRDRITRSAAGNPLFIGEMLAMTDGESADVVVPPTLRALLEARLDQIELAERRVLERGAVEGEIFHLGPLQSLEPDGNALGRTVRALVSRELIRPDRSAGVGEDAYRFGHLLIRDAAYESLAKSERADLHVHLADWLEGRESEIAEADEILGFHLERACLYRAELGLPVDTTVAERARQRLLAGTRRAQLRGDWVAAVGLLERLLKLVPDADVDLAAESDLIDALQWAGRGGDALSRAEDLERRSSAGGDRVGELVGRLKAGALSTALDPEGATDEVALVVEAALPVFQAAGNDLALSVAYETSGWVASTRGRMDAGLQAWDAAVTHARRAGRREEFVGFRASVRLWGTTPLTELIRWLDEHEPRDRTDHRLQASRAWALAMLDRVAEGRAILAESRAQLVDRGAVWDLGVTNGLESVFVELLAGDPLAAAEFGAEGCRVLAEQGELGVFSSAAGLVGQALYALDRLDEADDWAARAAEAGGSDDVLTQHLWRRVRAKVRARQGRHDVAEVLAREAVAISERTDQLVVQGDVYADLAEVLTLAGRPGDAARALGQALDCYVRKGNLVSAAWVRERLVNAAPGSAERPWT